MLILMGRLKLAPANLPPFIAEARTLVPIARAAPGNLFFSIAVEEVESGTACMLERWQDQASLDAYLERPEVVALFSTWSDRIENGVLKYDASNERSPR